MRNVETIADKHTISVCAQEHHEGQRVILRQGPDVIILAPEDATALALALLQTAAEAMPAPTPAVVADPCYSDCVSPDVPAGYDTVLGYLAKHQPEVLDQFNYDDPQETQRDGWWLSHRCRERGMKPVYVSAPPVLARCGVFQVRAYPVGLLEKRWRTVHER